MGDMADGLLTLPRRVFLASPLAGDTEANVAYARRALSDCLMRGEAPFAPHLLYPQVLDEATPAERDRGMQVGQCWLRAAQAVVVYQDYGISPGMKVEIELAESLGIPVEYRSLAHVAPG